MDTKDSALSSVPRTFQLAGRQFSLSAVDVVDAVRRAVAQGVPPEAQSYRVWCVTIDGARLNVRWVIELATGLERSEYNSITAKEILRRLGLDIQRIGAEPAPASEEAASPNADERDGFFTSVIARVQAYLQQVGVSGFDAVTWPRWHYFQLRTETFPGSHYEVAIHRSTYEIGLHFESSQAQSLRRLAVFQPNVAHLSELYGEDITAAVWREDWGRVYFERPLQELDWHDVNGFGERVGRFIELTYPILREAYAGAAGGRSRSVAAPPEIHAILDAEVDAMRLFLLGRSARPSDERLCDLVHFCYTFALYNEATQLFRLVDPSQVNAWYYERTKRLAKASALRL